MAYFERLISYLMYEGILRKQKKINNNYVLISHWEKINYERLK